jgi:hypothetical protein
MMMKILLNKISLFLVLALFAGNAIAQEGLSLYRLNINPVVQKASAEKRGKSQQRASIADTIPLTTAGFVDDFSYDSPFPDTSLWLDEFVYVNRGFAKDPYTVGMATFDGLDSSGVPYNWSTSPTGSYKADYLTSKPIDLSVILPGDLTTYFSFFYQREGLGNDPESHDSLVLEFKEPGGGWDHVWALKGAPLGVNGDWNYVILPVQGAYLQKGFQFRFYNYATLLGNLDHWHIDYVYLNKNRNVNDTLFNDVAFVEEPQSLLFTYSAVPWRHFDTLQLKDTLVLNVRNNNNAVKNVDFVHRVLDGSGTPIYTSPLLGHNVQPYEPDGYDRDTAFGLSVIPQLTGPAVYTFEAILNTTPDKNSQNDTVRHRQEFSYHYAYDDGTAESALGASTMTASIDLAQRFTTSVADTLRYVDIFFNPVVTNASAYTFRLKVWSASGSAPGGSLFQNSEDQIPAYYGTQNNTFVRYLLSSPLFLPAGTYFVGFHQSNDWFLNVGLDLNNNTQDKVYYNTSGTWYSSPYEGSLMLRPVFGDGADFVGIPAIEKELQLNVFPNPATDKLNFSVLNINEQNVNYTISDISGRTVLHGKTFERSVDVSALSGGIYFLRIMTAEKSSVAKFIITR